MNVRVCARAYTHEHERERERPSVYDRVCTYECARTSVHVGVGTYLHTAQNGVVYATHSSHGGALHPDLHRLQTTTTRLNALLPDSDLENSEHIHTAVRT